MSVYCTFSCPRLLFVLGMVPHGVPVLDGGTRVAEAAQVSLARALARDVLLVEGELFVELDDPIEAIVAARDHDLYLQRCIASGAALELLRQPDPAARETWRWLCKKLSMSPHQTYPDGLVKLGIGRHGLPEGSEAVASERGIVLWVLPAEDPDEIVHVDDGTELALDCLITQRTGHWIVEDRGSPNGVFCEGRRVSQRRLLPGTMIRVGASLIVVLSVR